MGYEFNSDQLAWLDALESGNYQQCKRRLHDGVGYCCLGVACSLLLGKPNNQHGLYTWGRHYTYAHPDVVKRLRLVDGKGSIKGREGKISGRSCFISLADANDINGLSFSEIASFIRANPEKVFL